MQHNDPKRDNKSSGGKDQKIELGSSKVTKKVAELKFEDKRKLKAELQKSVGTVLDGHYGGQKGGDRYMDALVQNEKKEDLFAPKSGALIVTMLFARENPESKAKDGAFVKLIKKSIEFGVDMDAITTRKGGDDFAVMMSAELSPLVEAYRVKISAKMISDYEKKIDQKTLQQLSRKSEIIAQDQLVLDLEETTELYKYVDGFTKKISAVCKEAGVLLERLPEADQIYTFAKEDMSQIVEPHVLTKEVANFHSKLVIGYVQSVTAQVKKNQDINPHVAIQPFSTLHNLMVDTLRMIASYDPNKYTNPQRVIMLENLILEVRSICKTGFTDERLSAEFIAEKLGIKLIGLMMGIRKEIERFHHEHSSIFTRSGKISSSALYKEMGVILQKYPELVKSSAPRDVNLLLSTVSLWNNFNSLFKAKEGVGPVGPVTPAMAKPAEQPAASATTSEPANPGGMLSSLAPYAPGKPVVFKDEGPENQLLTTLAPLKKN